jgi:hypothetical protein
VVAHQKVMKVGLMRNVENRGIDTRQEEYYHLGHLGNVSIHKPLYQPHRCPTARLVGPGLGMWTRNDYAGENPFNLAQRLEVWKTRYQA